MSNQTIKRITRGSGFHWVGDGFHVNSMFSYNQDPDISPFLLLDYAVPTHYSPATTQRGVGQHPHRGFETVTIVYAGEVEHRDTAGNAGKIGPGDVQWMTAARGVLHEEKHSAAFTQSGGEMEMVQLWVNLPAQYKMSTPRYQTLMKDNIPVVSLDNNAGTLRVIAGHFAGVKGVAKTFTPVHLYDIALNAGATLPIDVESGFSAMLLVLSGDLLIESKHIQSAELVMFMEDSQKILIEAEKDSRLLFMSGKPINEPIVGMGPFVMNTEEEIYKAYADFNTGKF